MEILGEDYFDDLTHPKALKFEHSNWLAFQEQLKAACDSTFPRNTVQHSSAHVLLLNWVDDDLQTDPELRDLERQWKTQFNYTTEIWKIPSQGAMLELDLKIGKVRGEHWEKGKLLIVYYGGHGVWHERKSKWAARDAPDSPTVNWSAIQPMLTRTNCDTVILLDCCFAGSAGRSKYSEGTTELLAACGMEVDAEGSFGTRPFTVNELYERLLKSKRRLARTPQYVPLTGRGRPSIRIAPMRHVHPEMTTSSSRPGSSQGSSSSLSIGTSPMTSLSNSSSAVRLDASCRVLLAVSLKDDTITPSIESWTRWLSSDTPPDILKISPQVRIEEAFTSNSTLVLVSMPVSVWCYLPDSSAYRFVDFIRGDSLLKKERTSTVVRDVSYEKNAEPETPQNETLDLGRPQMRPVKTDRRGSAPNDVTTEDLPAELAEIFEGFSSKPQPRQIRRLSPRSSGRREMAAGKKEKQAFTPRPTPLQEHATLYRTTNRRSIVLGDEADSGVIIESDSYNE